MVWLVLLACVVTLLAYWIVPRIAIYMGLLKGLIYKASGENYKVTCYFAAFFDTLHDGVISLFLGTLILRLGHGLMDWYWLLCVLIIWRLFRPYRGVPEVVGEAYEISTGISLFELKAIMVITTAIVVVLGVVFAYGW